MECWSCKRPKTVNPPGLAEVRYRGKPGPDGVQILEQVSE